MEGFYRIAKEYPERIAYQVGEEKISFGELCCQSEYYAELLRKQGEKPVILYGHKEIYMVIGILACLKARRVYVPIEKDIPLYRIDRMIQQTEASLIISEKKLAIEGIDCCSLKELERYQSSQTKDCQSDIAYIMFTSGSTGQPKGVPIGRQNLSRFIEWIRNLFPLSEYDSVKVLNQANFSFDLSVADIFYSLCNGHHLMAFSGNWLENPSVIFAQMKEIEVAVLTPGFARLCLLNQDWNCRNFPFLRCIYFCGEKLDKNLVARLWRAFPHLKILNAYGPTEATSAVSAILVEPEMLLEEELAVGEVAASACEISLREGEILLKGESVFSGYLQTDSPSCFAEEGRNCYLTGDYGYIRNGKLYISGRKDNQIKWKGYRIELEDIEKNLRNIEGVKEAVVVAKRTEDKSIKMLKAFVVKEEGTSPEDIKAELAKRIPQYMIPKIFRFPERLPLTANGKIDRKELERL